MVHKLKVAPSIIAGDHARLGEEVRAIEVAGADILHLDIMDGHFVPNITFGPKVVEDLRKVSGLCFDCHLMLEKPCSMIEEFCRAGADRVSVHVEAKEPRRALELIKAQGKLGGIAINPETDVALLDEFLEIADFFVVMTVHPGFYGQSMIVEALDKVPIIKEKLKRLCRDCPVQVDGGVSPKNVELVARAMADEVVAGAGVFGATDYRTAIEALRG